MRWKTHMYLWNVALKNLDIVSTAFAFTFGIHEGNPLWRHIFAMLGQFNGLLVNWAFVVALLTYIYVSKVSWSTKALEFLCVGQFLLILIHLVGYYLILVS